MAAAPVVTAPPKRKSEIDKQKLVLIGGGFAVWMIPAIALADRVGAPLSPAHLATYRMAMDMGMIAGPLVLGGLASLAGDRLAVGAAGFVLLAGALALARW